MTNIIKFGPRRSVFAHPFFRSTFSDLWDDTFTGKEFAAYVPAVNIHEEDKSWHIEVSAAGFAKEDFRISLEKDVLTISADKKEESGNEGRNYHRREFRHGSFSRSFRLMKDSVDEKGITASYENGILTIVVPKKGEVKDESMEIRVV
ncbi:MAG TPA: Hsp20/alpha crystallin family protein [Bacteroidia bacterium]|nr:Hsp20/alpha crystallin family protein [Bacteroidia bacterium]